MDLVQDSASAAGLGDAGKRVMEQYELESEIKKREKATAGAGKAAQAKLMETYGGVLSKPYEEFKPSQESLGGFAALGSLLMVAGAMMGGKGRLSGIGAMNNIAGMMKGYQQGRKDLYEQERQQFEQNMKTFEKNRGMIKEAFDRALKIAPTNLKLANDMLRRDLQALGATVPAEMVGKSGAVQAAGSYQTFSQNTDKTLEQLRAQLSRSKALTQAEEADIKAKKTARELAGTVGTPKMYTWKEDGVEKKQLLTDAEAIKKRDTQGVTDLAVEKTKTGGTAMNQRFGYNMSEAFAQAATDLENMSKMPKETVLGSFAGMTGQSGTGLVDSLRKTFARSLTPEDQRMFQQLIAGFGNNMGRALGGGYANSGAKHVVDQYNIQVAQEGDSPAVKAMFMARAKQELKIFAKAFQTYPGATDEQKEFVKEYYDIIDQSIPFTVEDVLAASSGIPGPKPPGAGKQESTYKSVEEVQSAYQAGTLSYDDAAKILKDDFGVE